MGHPNVGPESKSSSSSDLRRAYEYEKKRMPLLDDDPIPDDEVWWANMRVSSNQGIGRRSRRTSLDAVTVKVLDATGVRPGKYITLSHCWGPPSHVTTQLTTENSADYATNGIPLQQLPNTFRHAVLFCRELGIPYLWIDSLCIIQDDHED
ncbi:hypothetical protein B0T16DRAFT_461779 [Cercophora newfieldiana]|uniref:Heterokaryon incompatibility domain-containing protein n=1 Tax=Cercophora newfieldiana TaxID=92897 RepID=A0AA39XWW3_9PEZI|nr:hypothetical protein B0T16DRAFT_461779 [Cercophora newfieldiana]